MAGERDVVRELAAMLRESPAPPPPTPAPDDEAAEFWRDLMRAHADLWITMAEANAAYRKFLRERPHA